MSERVTHTCESCAKVYSTSHGGTAKLCMNCYQRQRRGGLKRNADPNRVKRTVPVQVKFTPAEHGQLMTALTFVGPAVSLAHWIRTVALNELNHVAALKRLNLGPGETPGSKSAWLK